MPRRLSSPRPAYFRTRTPNGDGNEKAPHRKPAVHAVFQNTNPERGRKLIAIPPIHLSTSLQFQNTNPERGRKRRATRRKRHSRHLNFRTRTPKGDGNLARYDANMRSARHFRTRTPKGDGNARFAARYLSLAAAAISEHEPRKGTETGACRKQGR